MLHFLPSTFKGFLASAFYALNTLFLCTSLIIVAFFRFVLPITFWRKLCSNTILWIADRWVKFNSLSMQQLNNIKFHLSGDTSFQPDAGYLIIANHQSSVDIIAMQHVLHGKIPFLKFFLKQELIFFPFLGLAWWALDFPFMKRSSKSQLRKNPKLKGKDIEATRKACKKFENQPISIVNFVEGTRFSENKNLLQGRPFENLLKPRAGGAGYVITLLNEQIHYILNVTISYPKDQSHYWQFVTGKIKDIFIHIEAIPLTDVPKGNYITDPKYRTVFQSWLTALWLKKDQRLHLQKKLNA